jgi:hypothetical protein
MMHFGLAGVFGAPRQVREPEPLRFREGEVWRSPRGAVYGVRVTDARGATLLNLRTGRSVRRAHEELNKPWERMT